MANTVTLLNYANTFGDWVVATNALAAENNEIAANNYTKTGGTFTINSPGTGLQVANNAIVQGVLTVAGVGSAATVQNTLTVQGQILATNTTGVGLVVSNTANIANVNITGSGTGLYVANNTLLGGTLRVTGATALTGTLTSSGTANMASVVANSYITAPTSYAEQSYTNLLVANNSISAAYGDVVNSFYGSNLFANTAVQTPTLIVTDTANVRSLSANVAINTSTLYVSTIANVATLFANGAITGETGSFKDLTVSGNFIINGDTIYDSDTFNLKGGSPITGTDTAVFGVNRQSGLPNFTPNAAIQFSNATGEWSIRNITGADANTYSNIVTERYTANVTHAGLVQLSNSNTSSSITQALSLAGANTLSQYITATAAGANTVLVANVATINSSITANVANLYSSITSNVATINSSITSNVSTLRSEESSNSVANFAHANGAYNLANTSVQYVTGTTGKITVTGNTSSRIIDLANTTAIPGSYGSGTTTPVFTVDAQGRITSVTSVTITGGSAGIGATTYERTAFTATAGQTTFTVDYIVGYIQVYLNGVLLPTADYTATNGTSVVLAVGAYAGDTVETFAFDVSNVLSIAGGSSGTVLYQSAANTTSNTDVGTSGYLLTSAGTGKPTWTAQNALTLQSSQVTTALGFTPYNSTNPSGYITATPNASTQVTSLGVGTAASGTTGEIRATNNITGYYSSDKKFKENVRDIPDALTTVNEIGGKLFDWTDDYLESKGGQDGYFNVKHDFGVIAQDVQKVFPIAVRTREDGTLAVDYEKLSALAFAAIVELTKKVEELEGKIK